jgi:hypothetical protein
MERLFCRRHDRSAYNAYVDLLFSATTLAALALAGAEARVVVVNVAGAQAAPLCRAVEAQVQRAHGKLVAVELAEEVHQALIEPFDLTADEEPARSLLAIARKRYADLAYERALEALLDAETKARRAEPAPELWQLLTEIHVLSGLVDTARGAVGPAVNDFRVARALDAHLTLDPAYYPPAVRARFAQAAPDAPGRGSGQLEVDDPAGAEVLIDGQAAGHAPVLRELPEGDHYVALAAPGREPRIERIPVVSGKRSHVSVFLARRPVADQVRALVAAVRRQGTLAPAQAQELGQEVGADLVLALDDGRVRPFWVAPPPPGRPAPTLPELRVRGATAPRLDLLLAALPFEPSALTTPGAGGPATNPAVIAGSQTPGGKAWYRRWWVWALGGAVTALGTALAVTALSGSSVNYSLGP